MSDKNQIETILHQHGYKDYQWMNPQEIVVSRWVRMKCEFGCPDYGRIASCPPNLPSVEECQRFFLEYQNAIVFHYQKVAPDAAIRKTWTTRTNVKLVKLEYAVFLAGYPKSFALFVDTCGICPECVPHRADCKKPKLSRPTVEGLAVDIFSTVRKLGYPIDVLTDPSQTMNRYALLLVD
jgi:predicted metal-binding protein